MNKSLVESFDLDHTKVVAPYIRLAATINGLYGDTIYKYDIRFKQPNKDYMDMPGLHSLEHLMAHYLRCHSNDIVDVSPMGCQTGFYVTVLNNKDWHSFANIIEKTLQDVLTSTEVPACNELQCGWAANHSLNNAKDIARTMLTNKEKWESVFS